MGLMLPKEKIGWARFGGFVRSYRCSKWVVNTLEPNSSNLQELLKFKLKNYQLHHGGKWSLNLKWCIHKNHKGHLINNILKVCKLACNIVYMMSNTHKTCYT